MVSIQCGSVRFDHLQAVIFDKDGTLANSQDYLRNLAQKRARLIDAQIPGVQEPLLMAFGLNGEQLNPAGLMAVGTRYENEIVAAAYVAETGRDWVESLGIVRSAFMEADKVFRRKAESTHLFEGGREVLQSLNGAGLKVGILSSDRTELVQDFVKCYQLEALVQLQMGTDRGPAKPDPVLLHQACQLLGVEPNKTLVIGDSTADLEMARAAGAAGFVGATWGWNQPLSLKQATVCLSHISEIQVVRPDRGVI